MAGIYPWKGEDITEEMKKSIKAEGYREELDIHDIAKEEDFKRIKIEGAGYIYAAPWAINDDRGFVCVEDFGPGEEFDWTFWHDEFQYILLGKRVQQTKSKGAQYGEESVSTFSGG